MKATKLLLSASAASLILATPADAANLLVFGSNGIASLYSAGGHSVTFATDANIATAGYLDSFDAFVYTRPGSNFGGGLSAAAAAAMKSFVTGNVVLFNGDFADDINVAAPANTTNLLFNNALDYVLGGSGKGYIGEFNGAVAAYGANANGFSPIGLVDGTAGPLGFGNGGSSGDINLTAVGGSHAVTAGVPFPYNPAAVEFGSSLTGENPAKVLARFANGNAAIIASEIEEISGAVPEPSTWAMMLLGFGFLGGALRHRRRQQTKVNFAF